MDNDSLLELRKIMTEAWEQDLPEEKREKAYIRTNYKEKYYPILTKPFDEAIHDCLKKKTMFTLLASPAGGGKTTAIYRQAKILKWNIIEFNSNSNLFSEETRDDMMGLIKDKHKPPLVILLDDIEPKILPQWIYPEVKIFPDGTSKVRNKRKSFLEIAQRNYKKGRFMIVATTSDQWKLPYHFTRFFNVIKTNGPWPSHIEKVMKEHKMFAPKGLRDIRQIHQIIQSGGLNDSYVPEQTSFDKISNWLGRNQRGEIPDVRPKFETWMLENILNADSTGIIQQHMTEFYDMLAILAMADQYDRAILRALPVIRYLSYGKIKHPNKLKRSEVEG